MFDIPLTFKDEHVNKLFTIDAPEIFNDEFNDTILFNTVLPLICNVPIIVVLFDNVVAPETFNDETIVTLLFNVVNPDIFNADNNVTLFDNVVKPETFNDDISVVLLFNDV